VALFGDDGPSQVSGGVYVEPEKLSNGDIVPVTEQMMASNCPKSECADGSVVMEGEECPHVCTYGVHLPIPDGKNAEDPMIKENLPIMVHHLADGDTLKNHCPKPHNKMEMVNNSLVPAQQIDFLFPMPAGNKANGQQKPAGNKNGNGAGAAVLTGGGPPIGGPPGRRLQREHSDSGSGTYYFHFYYYYTYDFPEPMHCLDSPDNRQSDTLSPENYMKESWSDDGRETLREFYTCSYFDTSTMSETDVRKVTCPMWCKFSNEEGAPYHEYYRMNGPSDECPHI
jgi:hypothetical protein